MNHHHHRPPKKTATRHRIIDYIGGTLFFGFLAFLFSLIIVDLARNWKMRDWPYTEATLVERNLTLINRSESRWDPGVDYRADYVFSYHWQEHTYYMHDQFLVKLSGSDRKFWEFRNPVGVKKIVRINPHNPDDATLKWGPAWEYDIALGSFALGLLVAGLLWLYRSAKQS